MPMQIWNAIQICIAFLHSNTPHNPVYVRCVDPSVLAFSLTVSEEMSCPLFSFLDHD
jgi:hypothetical protein